MRRGLAWLLAAALVLSGLALWVPQRAGTIVQAIDARRALPAALSPGQSPSGAGLLPLPVKLERLLVEPGRRDPFSDPLPPAAPPQPVVVPPPVVMSPVPAPALPASPPPLTWRLLGTMDSPTGERLVMLVPHDGQQSVLAAPGARLEGGYEVASVQADAVRVMHVPTQTEVVIPIPPPSVSER